MVFFLSLTFKNTYAIVCLQARRRSVTLFQRERVIMSNNNFQCYSAALKKFLVEEKGLPIKNDAKNKRTGQRIWEFERSFSLAEAREEWKTARELPKWKQMRDSIANNPNNRIKQKYFNCFDNDLYEFLTFKGHVPIKATKHRKTKKPMHIYIEREELMKDLKIYRALKKVKRNK